MKCKFWILFMLAFCLIPATSVLAADKIIHDGEYSFIEAQHAEEWAKEDKSDGFPAA